MPRALILRHRGVELSFTIEKLDRTKLYGSVDVEALDDQGRRCELATLASDGKTYCFMDVNANCGECGPATPNSVASLIRIPLEPDQVDQHGLRRRLASQRRNLASFLHVVDGHGFHHATGHGLACQMSAAYSAMVRSLENLPALATFRIALRAHASGSAYSAQRLPSASRYEARSARCM